MIKRVSHEVNRASGGPRKSRDKGKKFSELDITSLVDILTILLLFLIQSVSVTAQKKTIAQGIEPPKTIKTDKLLKNGQTIVIIFTKENIEIAGGKFTALSYNNLMSNTDIARKIKKGLYNFLRIEAGKIVKRAGNNIPLMLIQADKSIPCVYINNFIKFSASSGFANIYFATKEEPVNIYAKGGV